MKGKIAIAAIVCAIAAFIPARAIASESCDSVAPIDQKAAPTAQKDDEKAHFDWNVAEMIRTVNWPATITSMVIDGLLREAVVYPLKKHIHEWRPDYTDNKSFPSRHSAWAFDWVATISLFTVKYSPWWGVLSQTAGNAVGFQRVMSKRHYPGDVIAGGSIGICTYLTSTVIANKIWGAKYYYSDWHRYDNTFERMLWVSTGASIPLQEHYGSYTLGTALLTAYHLQLPATESVGFCAEASLTTAPIKMNGRYMEPFSTIGVLAGAETYYSFGRSPYAVSASAMAGYAFNLKPNGIPVSFGSVAAQVAGSASVMLTRSCSFGAQLSIGASRLRIGDTARWLTPVSFSLHTAARF